MAIKWCLRSHTLQVDAAAAARQFDSLQRVGDVQLAFVALAPGEYETRRVKTGLVDGEDIEVLAGVTVGEAVVTLGSFLLKTETLKGSIGAGCCE